jgi:ribonuclease HI
MTKIYCDGACRGNPGKSGSGVIVYTENKTRQFAGGFEENGTNNTAELRAFLAALSIVDNIDGNVEILTDSQYTINSITKWAYSWKSKNWKKKGGEIKNLDLIRRAHSKYVRLKDRITVSYVKGHSGDKGNDAADALANKAIDNMIVKFLEV